MIRPDPRSSMCGSAAWLMKNAPDRLTASTLYQSSSVIFITLLSLVMPALLTSTSSRPWRWITSLTVHQAIVGRADVALMDAGGDVVLLELVQQLLGVLLVAAVAGGDHGALLGEAAADRRADPARPAGHEHHPSRHPRPAIPGRERLVGRNYAVARRGPLQCQFQ